MPWTLNSRTALVTGASRSIGKVIALALLALPTGWALPG